MSAPRTVEMDPRDVRPGMVLVTDSGQHRTMAAGDWLAVVKGRSVRVLAETVPRVSERSEEAAMPITYHPDRSDELVWFTGWYCGGTAIAASRYQMPLVCPEHGSVRIDAPELTVRGAARDGVEHHGPRTLTEPLHL